MSKAYWVSCYREITDAKKYASYIQLAIPAIAAGGGIFLARDVAAYAYEDGQQDRTIIIEFPDLESARATHDGEAYAAALEALGDGAVRDIRLVGGV
ncbi:DUF1330 domain-containing protein [Halomonas sp. M5N1S17]|uniref:DUF1330 domain-containing protein n=1 Tax=Billgrantia montanilacus TaxID=2282305 RepID=A0A368U4N8_9GAMM|nr:MULTISPECIES: DUF1330 domain-containing protein [Halomonas]MCE9664214.1 DUF1330 domain-containing protein [Halomonas alkalisoli]RCV89993.1 DUF1330 domain-containing protein [Halomonas montanilacus]